MAEVVGASTVDILLSAYEEEVEEQSALVDVNPNFIIVMPDNFFKGIFSSVKAVEAKVKRKVSALSVLR